MEEKFDLEKKLDSELLTESSLFDANKPLKLYFNRKNALRRSKRISLLSPILIALPVIFLFLLYCVMKVIFGDAVRSLQTIYFFSAVFIVLLATPCIVLINVLGHRTYKESLKPAIEIDPTGISINCAGRNFRRIPWELIREVTKFEIYGWTYVRVVPHDPSILKHYECEDETQSGRLLWAFMKRTVVVAKFLSMGRMNDKLNQVYSQPWIDIPDEFLPLGAQEVVDSINIRLMKIKRLEEEV
ncbi:MAG: hypothetical protein KIT34_07890 [Cyanobacteria bacterium TGS_CYA1]|nr:hypothetical protein [Cyanobacteria bacterium TGS_CYA1]